MYTIVTSTNGLKKVLIKKSEELPGIQCIAELVRVGNARLYAIASHNADEVATYLRGLLYRNEVLARNFDGFVPCRTLQHQSK